MRIWSTLTASTIGFVLLFACSDNWPTGVKPEFSFATEAVLTDTVVVEWTNYRRPWSASEGLAHAEALQGEISVDGYFLAPCSGPAPSGAVEASGDELRLDITWTPSGICADMTKPWKYSGYMSGLAAGDYQLVVRHHDTAHQALYGTTGPAIVLDTMISVP